MTTRTNPRNPSRPRGHTQCWRAPLRGLLFGAALTVAMAVGWPPLPMVGLDLGADPAFAKNGNSNGDRGNRGNGHGRRDGQGVLRLFDDDGSRIWNGNGHRTSLVRFSSGRSRERISHASRQPCRAPGTNARFPFCRPS